MIFPTFPMVLGHLPGGCCIGACEACLSLPRRRIVVDSVVPTDGPREPVGPAQTFTFIKDPPDSDTPPTD